MTLFENLSQAVIDGDEESTGRLTEEALEAGHSPVEVLEEGLFSGMSVVGNRFRVREIFLPNVLLAARAMHAALAILQPLLEANATPTKGTVVIGTVGGDVHDIGKNLVGIMLRGAGYSVVDLGYNVYAPAFVEAVREHDAKVVGMSALLTTTMPVMQQVVSALADAGLGDVKVIVGGAPVSDKYAKEIGATAYGDSPADAVEAVRQWVQ